MPVSGVATKDHAFCIIKFPDRAVDVETTIFYGFDPGKNVDVRDEFGKVTGFTYIPPTEHGKRSEANDLVMLSYILQNRIAILQDSDNVQKHAQIVPLAIDRYDLIQTAKAFNEMFLALENYIISLKKDGKNRYALAFAQYAIEERGNKPFFTQHTDTLLHNLIAKTLSENKIGEAKGLYAEYHGIISPERATILSSHIAESEIVWSLNNNAHQQALEKTENAFREQLLSQQQYSKYLEKYYFNESQNIEISQGSVAAYTFILEGISKLGDMPSLLRAREAYENNAIIDIYNHFVLLYNNNEYTDAKRIINEGLLMFPVNKDLLEAKAVLADK